MEVSTLLVFTYYDKKRVVGCVTAQSIFLGRLAACHCPAEPRYLLIPVTALINRAEEFPSVNQSTIPVCDAQCPAGGHTHLSHLSSSV